MFTPMLRRFFPDVNEKISPKCPPLVFVSVLLQVCALFAVIHFYKLETSNGLDLLLPWIAGGYAVHHFLPGRFRNAFFVLLTWAALLSTAGPLVSFLVVAGILLMTGIAHLPVAFRLRVLLACLAGIIPVVLRMQRFYVPRAILASSIIGLLLMFRFILYMHEIRYEKTKPTFWQRLSYFFMLPNLCFPLFPIVDYKTFVNNQYSETISGTWRSGVRKILRGVTHLLVYRVTYFYFVPSPVLLHGPGDFFLFIFTSYLLILRLSGIFYIATGSLHLFGYPMPPVFNNFFLIPSFAEIWRRTNIYWMEFIKKVFYYPAWFRLRKIKWMNPVLVSSMFTFLVTWLLHSWQWFWILGRFPLAWTDFLYWMVLGGVITVNLLIEEKRGGVKKQVSPGWSFLSSLRLVLNMCGIFFFMSFLWSFWNSHQVSSWLFLLHHLGEGTMTAWLKCLIIFCSVLLAGTGIHFAVHRYNISLDRPMKFPATMIVTLAACALLLLPVLPSVSAAIPGKAKDIVLSLREPQLNQYDKENLEQGYYEQLLEDPGRSNPWEVHVFQKPERKASEEITINTNNLLQRRMKPSTSVQVDFYHMSSNQWGMRDREYTKEKPPHTFRIALLGGSYEMGVGVNDGETFEALLENELNDALVKNDSITHIEILNFAGAGYHLLQHVWLCDHEVFEFDPDLVIYMAHSEDARRLNGFFASLIQNGIPLEYPFLVNVKNSSGAAQGESRDEIQSRLLPFSDSLFTWGYRKIGDDCREHHAEMLWVFLPATADKPDPAETHHQEKLAQDAGFEVLEIHDPYTGFDIHQLQLGNGDTHPNKKGHELIAHAIFNSVLQEHPQVFRKLQFKIKS